MTIPRHRGPDVYYDVSAVVPAADYGGGDDDGYWRWQHDDLQLMWVHLWVRVKEPIMAEIRDLLDLFYYGKKNAKQEIKASKIPMEMVPTWDGYHGDKDHFPMYSLYMETTCIFRMTL